MPRSGARLASLAVVLVFVAGLVAPASADTATGRIRGFFASVNRVIADPAYEDRLPQRLAALRGLVVEIVDFPTAAAVALGPEWAARAPGEREEFARLFTDLLQASVFSSVGGRARLDNGLTVTYIGELNDADGVTVATSVLTRHGSEMAVGYRMALRDGRWIVRDVVVDGVSLVDNYRAQFQKVMSRSSYAGLVSEMRARIAELGPAAPSGGTSAAPGTIVTAAPTTIVAAPPGDDVKAAEPAPIPSAPAPPVVVAAVPREPAEVEPRIAEARRQETYRADLEAAASTPHPPAPPRVIDYWVQVGAFRNVDKAMQLATALRDQTVALVTTPEQPLLRVLVGPFTDRDAAAAKLRQIRARGYDAFIAEALR